MARFDSPFVGSEAVVAGAIRKHEQRSRYFAVFPDVYLEKDAVPTLHQRAKAGWLWSHRQGVIAGLTASALHGVKWVDDAAPVELIWPNARPASGLRTYDYRLRTDEFGEVDGMRITTVARAGFDIARRRPLDAAIANLDALGNATGCKFRTYCESPGSTAAHADCSSSGRSSPYMTPAPLRRRNVVALW